MKTALVAVFALSASLSLSAAPSPFQIVPPGEEVSVTKLEAGRGGGGGGGGSGARGFSGASARGFSGGPRGNIAGYRGAARFSGYRGALGSRYGGTAIRPTGAVTQRQFAAQGNRASRQLNRGVATVHRNNHALSNNRASGGKRSLSDNRSRAGEMRQKENGSFGRRTLTTHDGRTHKGQWARNNPANQGRFDTATQQKLRTAGGPRSDVNEARRRHRDHCHGHHNRDWWHNHCNVIILAGWGWWGWWNGWWYPTWGYDPYFSYYPYDAPIYAYGGLPPDEVIANVQSELQRRGYYQYAVDGVAGAKTQAALNRYQRDRRIPITGTIDQTTLASLGLTE
ncbi:MAG TPA: peptidoglycan-binding domain-containing protein [Chthoniobacterales bacterium]|nr:peptidoglycan-binding domain-containing protein [Chthoniobacterales bacterium]